MKCINGNLLLATPASFVHALGNPTIKSKCMSRFDVVENVKHSHAANNVYDLFVECGIQATRVRTIETPAATKATCSKTLYYWSITLASHHHHFDGQTSVKCEEISTFAYSRS